MSILYQRLVAIALMAALCYPVQAQKLAGKTDKIHKLDKTVIENIFVVEVNKTEIRYKENKERNDQTYIISKKDIWKIEWNNGEKEEINPLAATAIVQTSKPTDLLVKRKTIAKIFWEKQGAYWGVTAGAGLSKVSKSDQQLIENHQLTYSGGLVIGYHQKVAGVQIEALYTQSRYEVVVPGSMGSLVQKIQGYQSQLTIPVNATVSKKLGSVRVGAMAGGFATAQIGGGSLKVAYPDGKTTHTRNCASCSKDFGYGLTGGLGITLLENSFYTFYINARYYYNLGNNKEFRVGETGVSNHAMMVNGGILFHFPNAASAK